jgi:hypothetical protein
MLLNTAVDKLYLSKPTAHTVVHLPDPWSNVPLPDASSLIPFNPLMRSIIIHFRRETPQDLS